MSLHERIEALHELDDDALLRSLKRFVGSSNHLTALVLAHLAEVDARGAYRRWACDTLTTYCVYELRLSEDEAQRRCRAARIARQFPVLFDMLADASIHLTGILMLGPYLTDENHREILARARYRRKAEIQRLVAELAPSCDVPAVIEPLGPARSTRVVPRSGWGAMHEALMGGVRRLATGDGPAEAPSAAEPWRESLLHDLERETAVPATLAPSSSEAFDDSAPERSSAAMPSAERSDHEADAPPPGKPQTAPLRYKVQFTADQEYVQLFERARALAWHQLPSGDIAALQKLAMQALVDKLLRRKCAVKYPAASSMANEPSASTTPNASDSNEAVSSSRCGPTAPALNKPDLTQHPRAKAPAVDTPVMPRSVEPAAPARNTPSQASPATKDSSRPSPTHRRRLPAALRRTVWERDGGRCTFIDERGQRCSATAAIEFHHEQPRARGGPDSIENVHLRCRAHNDLAAERDFGRAFMRAKRARRAAPRCAEQRPLG